MNTAVGNSKARADVATPRRMRGVGTTRKKVR